MKICSYVICFFLASDMQVAVFVLFSCLCHLTCSSFHVFLCFLGSFLCLSVCLPQCKASPQRTPKNTQTQWFYDIWLCCFFWVGGWVSVGTPNQPPPLQKRENNKTQKHHITLNLPMTKQTPKKKETQKNLTN